MPLEWYIAGGLRQRGASTWRARRLCVAATLLAAIGIYGVMAYSVAQRQEGRNLAGRASRSDVLSPQAQRRYGIQVQRLVHPDRHREPCHELLLEDRTAGPAETAAARIDLQAWLSQLSRRNRRIALALARGESTGEAARKFQLSPGRISQLREVLRTHWERFHTPGPAAECAA